MSTDRSRPEHSIRVIRPRLCSLREPPITGPRIHGPEIQVPHRRFILCPRFLGELGLRPRARGGVDPEGGKQCGEIGLRDAVQGVVGLVGGDGG